MSRSKSDFDVSSSSSDDSDNDQSTNRELVIPSPVELSDSEDDGVSPSEQKIGNDETIGPQESSAEINVWQR